MFLSYDNYLHISNLFPQQRLREKERVRKEGARGIMPRDPRVLAAERKTVPGFPE